MPTTPRRWSILGEDEIEVLSGRPRFTQEERRAYFPLSREEKTVLEHLHSMPSRRHFGLQLGYVKARHLFFGFDLPEVMEDAVYRRDQDFPGWPFPAIALTKVPRVRPQRFLLALYHYRHCQAQERDQWEPKAQQAARGDSNPVYGFRALAPYLAAPRLVSPAYRVRPDSVGKARSTEQHRWTAMFRRELGPPELDGLHSLLEDAKGLDEITLLQREARDFSSREIARDIARGPQRRDFYKVAQAVLPRLDIASERIKYYASLVAYSSVFRLQQLDEWIVYLSLLCFVSHRQHKLHDHLRPTLSQHVRRQGDAAKGEAKERGDAHRREGNEHLRKAGPLLKLFTDESIAQSPPFLEVQATAFDILERQKIAALAAHLTPKARVAETAFPWEPREALAQQFQQHLRPILRAGDLAASPGHRPLTEAVHFLQDAFAKGRSLSQYPSEAFPLRCLPDTAKRYRQTSEAHGHRCLLPDRSELLVYRVLRNGLEAGDLFCRDSVRFRSFEDDLWDDRRWQDTDTLMTPTGLAILTQPLRDHLAELAEQLETRLHEVKQRIAAGENHHVEVQKRGRHVHWTLPYPRDTEPGNHAFFDALQQVDIGSVLHCANRHCHFMAAFEHVVGRDAKQERDDDTMLACLIAWASNMGRGRRGEHSDSGSHALATTSDNFLRLETLQEATERVRNAIATLPIFKHYDSDAVRHSSSDGQKCETRPPTIHARHAPKYFGLKKGVGAYPLLAHPVPINAEIIGANEHESHYVFDILFNNTTDLQPEVHSTETHGTKEGNVALLHVFGYPFAPRDRDSYDTVSPALYGFTHPSQYDEGWMLKPGRKLTPQLVLAEGENMQRLLVSLALQTTTQRIIVGKLSA